MHKTILYSVLFFSILFPLQRVWAESKKKPDSSSLSLEEAIETTLRQNPELKAMQKDVDAAHAKIPQARSWDDPMVGVRFFEVPFNQGITSADDIDYIVSQKISFPGKKKAASKQAYHEYLHHIESLGGRGRALLREVKTTYYSLFSVNRMIQVSREIETALRLMVQTSQSKIATNQAMATDAIQGQMEIAKLLLERQSLFERKKALEAKLNQLMASPTSEEIQLLPQLELPHWNLKLEQFIEIGKEKNPALKAAHHVIREKEWGIKAAKREYLPDLNAQLEYLQKPGPREDAWTGQFMINLPLTAKKKKKAVEQAEAEFASAQYGHQAAKNEVIFRIRESFAKMNAADQSLKINQRTFLPQARQAFETASFAYTVGKSDFIVFLTATRSLFDAKMEYWKSYESYASAFSELEERVGITREESANLNALNLKKEIHFGIDENK